MDARFKEGEMPRFRDVFRDRCEQSIKILKQYDFQPRLDDSGDDIESAIGQLTDLWRMYFDNDGSLNLDTRDGVDEYDAWWQDFFDGKDVYADDIRFGYVTEKVADSIWK